MTRSTVVFGSSGSPDPPEEPLRAEGEHEGQQDEREHDRVLRAALVPGRRQVRAENENTSPYSSDPAAAPSSDPMPPMITTTSE